MVVRSSSPSCWTKAPTLNTKIWYATCDMFSRLFDLSPRIDVVFVCGVIVGDDLLAVVSLLGVFFSLRWLEVRFYES